MKDYFDSKAWVKRYFNLNPSDKSLEETNNSIEFIWVWAIFENKYLKDSRHHESYNNQLKELALRFPVEKINVDSIYGFFYNRYYPNKRLTQFF